MRGRGAGPAKAGTVATIVILLSLLAGCSSSGASSPAATTAAGGPSGNVSTAQPFPLAGPVPSGPLGGDYCDPTAAHWEPSGDGIDVMVNAPAVSEVSVQVVDASNNPIGQGNGQVDAGSLGVKIHIAVTLSKIGGVALAIAGASSGTCAVKRG